MPIALARHGDPLGCGDLVAGTSPDVTINGLAAALTSGIATQGHCHGGTPIYPDAATAGSRPAITINGVSPALVGDWNVPAASQVPPNFPSGTGGGCGISCGATCHDSQITAGSSDTSTG